MMTLLFSNKADKPYLPLHKHKNTFCSKVIFPFIFFILILFSNFHGYAQTALISASDGGFENSTSTFSANGWTVVNGWLGSSWNVGTAAGVYSGTKSAFFGSGSTSYSGTGWATVVHFYRDIVVPAGATDIKLSFKLKYPIVDNNSDYFDVYTTTTAHTPASGIDPYYDWAYTNVFENTSTQYNSFTPLICPLPNSLAGTTVRLVFSFLNDGYSPYSAPAVDNITLTYTSCTSPTLTYTSTSSCVGGSTGTITGIGSGGSAPYSYSLDGVHYQSTNTFSGLSAGNYTLYVKSSGGCVASTPVTVAEYATSTGNQNAAGNNTWIGHTYDGNNFSRYIGYITEAETFNENFGGDATCLAVTSSSGTSSIYTESFSVAFKMNSTRKGLYVVDLGSDDGSRLTVDGTLLYNNWSDQPFTTKSRVLMNLTGSSSLNYEFYENGGGNQAVFQNLTLVLANSLSINTTQSICLGASGSAISGDVYGTLPAGIALSGTGYQWTYSTTPGGTKTNISGATGATFTPNTSTAPFNIAGTYYLYRKAIVTSTNNVGVASYTATNESNEATITINALPSANISYSGSPYCSGTGTATVLRTGTSGGTFSSAAGLNINSSTGAVDLVSSTPGTYTVTYTIAAANGCATYTATTNITITPKVSSLIFNAGSSSTRCQGAGTVIYSATANNSTGITYSLDATSLAAGNTINSSTGAVTFVAGWKGTSSIKAVASGCTPLSATHTVTTSPTPSGSISTTYTCIDGSSATITATGNTGISPFTYSLNSGTFQSSGTFTGLSAGNYSIQIKSNDGCIYSTSATVNPYPNSSGDQSAAGANTWIGHMYNGQNFDAYKGYFSESEIFDENFGGSGTCFPITSNVSGSTIYTDQFSVKFKMNSTRKGLYVVDLGSDDGSRLTVNGELIFNDWYDHAFAGRPRVLMNLDGNSSLMYEFYENGGDNRILFNNLTLVLENKLSSNITQSICMGNSGAAIGGDVFGTLPSGVSKYGTTGYQWTYSTTAGGTRSNISGATGATFTPNTSTAPFNTPGTYYVYRNAVLSSVNNTGKSPYVATNVSNVATIIINAIPSATISYANAPFCSTSSMSEKVTLTGTSGGTFSAPGLVINSVTGDIVPNANSIGSYTINYSIAATGGCSSFSTSTEIYIGAAGTWSGKMDNEWYNSANWICGIIPDCTIDVTIPKQVFNFPSVVTHYAEAKNLNIENGASLAISGTIRIGGAINNLGNLDIINGTLEMTGKTAQSISGSMFTDQTIKNLIVNNTSAAGLSVSSTPNDTLKLTGILSFGNSNSILNTGNNITLISNYDGTASVSIVGNHNAINGKVIVEKYINTGIAPGQHGKSWQFLSVPTLGQTIKESWMENKNEVSGYGTTMSGPGGVAAGFDLASAAPSIKYFSDVVNNWKGITDANELIANTQGYMVFVRGDRTVTSPTQVANTTVLRSKGTLFIGDQLPIKVKPGKFQSIGNPYASAIDFSLIRKDTVIDDAFYIYDPYLYGTYGVGGYQTLSSVNNWKPVPGGTSAYPGTVLSSIIQSGQAFFVHSHSSTEEGSVSFTEDCKSATSRPGHSSRLAEKVEGTQKQFLRASLITNAGLMADGNVVAFDKSYRDEIDGNDALKISNSGENFSVKSAGKLLTIEAKSPVSDGDTLYYNISNLSKTDYQLAFAPENMDNVGLQAYLVDKFLHTETPVSLSDSTFIKIAVTSGAGSAAADRFKVVFRQMKSLPVTLTSSHATPKNQNVLVNWKTENESGMLQYEVQRSPDGNIFQTSSVTPALNKGFGNYQWTDSQSLEGNNYYRIKIISKDGKVSYSPVMKVNMGKIIAAMEVAPNPILNGTIHLVFRNEPPGKYTVSLSNQLGQVILLRTILHTAESASASIPANSISKGIYNLLIVKPDGNKETVKIFIN